MSDKKYVDIRFEFVEKKDEYDEEYTYLELKSISRSKLHNMTDDDMDNIVESWGQSDTYWVDYTTDILSALDGRDSSY